jgi:hypothetical protein
MTDHEQAVTDVAAALLQVLSVSPQLLYEASTKLGSTLMVDAIRAELTPDENGKAQVKLVDRIKYRASICLMLSRVLVQSGRASLTADDVGAIIDVLQMSAKW